MEFLVLESIFTSNLKQENIKYTISNKYVGVSFNKLKL